MYWVVEKKECRLLLRGDSEGRLAIWTIPDVHDKKMKLVRQESFEKLPGCFIIYLLKILISN